MLTVHGIDLLLALNKLIESDGFVVIDITDIADALTGVSADEIDASMKELKVENLVILKLADSEEYCLKITEQGRNRAAEIIAMRERKANSQVLRVIKDDNGKTFVELQEELENADNKNDIDETEKLNEISLVDKKPKKRHAGISSFLWGALGGMITSVAAILTFVYAFAGI